MYPTVKTYTVRFLDGKEVDIKCLEQRISDDGKSVDFWNPKGSYLIRDGMIDAGGYWTLVASFQLSNIAGFILKSEIAIK